MNWFSTPANRKKVEMLKQLDVFCDLTFTEALEVNELLHERVYEKGEIIFQEGDIGQGIFVVVSGKVRVDASHEVMKGVLPEFGPGEMVGELTLFEEAPRLATAIAAERTVMVALLRAEFSSLLTRNTKIGVKILQRMCATLCQRVRSLLLGERHVPSL